MLMRSPNLPRGTPSPSVGGMPAWRTAIASRTWGTVSATNTLSSIDPANNPAINPNHPSTPEWRAVSGQPAIITAWCGACYDTATDTLHLPLGGGHADYAGNEPYKIAIGVDSPSWVMTRNPSGAIGNLLTTNDSQEGTGRYADGRPRAVHSYNKHVYVPGVGLMMGALGNTSWSAQAGSKEALKINETTGEATFLAVNTVVNGTSGMGTCYDPTRHVLWAMGAGTEAFGKFNIATNTWTTGSAVQSISGYSALTYLPDDDCIFWANVFFPNDFAILDCATGAITQPAVTGSTTGATVSGSGQPQWVPSLNAICFWDNGSNTTAITTMTKPANPRTGTWTIGTLAVDGGNTVTPTVRTSTGTYGRFQYSPRLNGFLLLNATNQPIYFFAL